MSDYTAKRIKEMETGFNGGFVKARAELGVTAFGMQVIQLPPNFSDYPDHDHAETGQEEVFLPIGGAGYMEVAGERVELDTETMVRVAPHVKRKVYSGENGLRMMVVGGTPGKAYSIVPLTELEGAAS